MIGKEDIMCNIEVVVEVVLPPETKCSFVKYNVAMFMALLRQ
jgi:hypothetical protein